MSHMSHGDVAICRRLDYLIDLLEKVADPKSKLVPKFSEDGLYSWYEASEVPDAER